MITDTSGGRCTIVPPYILERMATSDDPHVAERARAALEHDLRVRLERRGITVRPGRRPSAGSSTGSTTGPTTSTGTEPTQPPGESHGTGPHRTVSDARGDTTTPGVPVRREGEPETGDPAADEAYDGLGATWELWSSAFRRDSLDGRGMPLLATVHYGRDYDNAFWDGSQMVFGDGDGVVFDRFTRSLDVIGHELAHGVTEHTAGLMYQGQAGALNESVSDVFGVLVVQHSRGQSVQEADWLVGADLFAPGVNARALRDMRHPGTAYDDPRLGKDPQPDHMDRYVVTTDDHGGVHINSGIPNRAFVLAALALGGNAWETVGPIWYSVLDGPGIKADCDFATFADLTVAAAADRHGDGSREHVAVRSAWQEVGVLDAESRTGESDPAGSAGSVPRSGPAHGEVPGVDVDLILRRTGGFAGLVRERHTTLGELPESDARDWQHLLAGPTLQRIAAVSDRSHPDAFCYGVSCPAVEVDVQVLEPHLPAAIHDLFERTLRG